MGSHLGMPTPIKTNVLLPDDLLQAIGHVTALWAQLEYIIDSTIRQVLDRPNAPKTDTALILSFKKRINLLTTIAVPLLKDAKDREHLLALSTEVARLQHRRDLIVHGAVGGSEHLRGYQLAYTFIRIRWDRPIRILEKRAMSVAEVEAIALEISDQIAVAGLYRVILW